MIWISCIFVLTGQDKVFFYVKDKTTQEAIPYANILFNNGGGTMANVLGEFTVNKDVDSIYISSLGYEEKGVKLSIISSEKVVFLSPIDFVLSEITVFPGDNPAHNLLDSLWRKRYNFSIDSHKYSERGYNKFLFHLISGDSSNINIDFLQDKSINSEDPMLIMESVENRLHIPTSSDFSEIITSRVSGLKNPSLAAVTTQIHTFSLWENDIEILSSKFKNPLSPRYRDKYFYNLKDTINDSSGNLSYYITFKPKKSREDYLYGSVHICAKSLAVKTLSFTTIRDRKPFFASIRLNFKEIDSNLWHLEDLESYIILTFGSYNFRIFGNSIYTDVDLNSELTEKYFSGFSMIDNSSLELKVEDFRPKELSKDEEIVYSKIDSLGIVHKFDRLVDFQKELMKGYIPMGLVSLETDKLFGFNRYEGFRVGLGLKTNEKLSEKYNIDGFYTRSFKSRSNNFGGGVTFIGNRLKENSLNLQFYKNRNRIGEYEFLDGYKQFSSEEFAKISSNYMDDVMHVSSAFRGRVTNKLKTELSLRFENHKAVNMLPFMSDSVILNYSYELFSPKLRIKWQPFTDFIFSDNSIMEAGAFFPAFWLNYGYNLLDGRDNFHKIELQAEHHFSLFSKLGVALRTTFGISVGDNSLHSMYSNFGSYLDFGIESDYSFKTMRPNEFAASKFTLLFTKISLPTIFETTFFAPYFELLSSFGFGDVEDKFIDKVMTFNKGYFESGLRLNSILRSDFVSYGAGIHYRYGPYSYKDTKDNLSINIGVNFAF